MKAGITSVAAMIARRLCCGGTLYRQLTESWKQLPVQAMAWR